MEATRGPAGVGKPEEAGQEGRGPGVGGEMEAGQTKEAEKEEEELKAADQQIKQVNSHQAGSGLSKSA